MTDTTPRLLTEADIIAIDDIDSEVVEVPEWGGAVKLRGLSLDEAMATRAGADRDARTISLRMLAASFVEPKLTEAAVEVLGKKSAAVINRLLGVATRLCGMDPEAVQRSERTFRPEPADGVPVPPGA